LDDLVARDTRRDEKLDDSWREEAAELELSVLNGRPDWAVGDLERIEDLKRAVFG
jgi:hypothetical protein